jgi:hypothetical protein
MTTDIKSFSQALPILKMHDLEPQPAGNKLWRIGAQTLDKGGVIKLARELAAKNAPAGDAPFWQALSYGHPTAHLWRSIEDGKYRSTCGITSRHAPVGKRDTGHCSRCAAAQPVVIEPAAPAVLSAGLQERARRYVAARRRSGEALLEAVAELAAARAEAQHGEWGVFLEAVGLDESRARAQIRIHEEAEKDPDLAERIRTGWLSEAVARELLPAPVEVRAEILEREAPPSLQEVRTAKRASTPDLPWTCQVCGRPQTGMKKPAPPICTACAMQRIGPSPVQQHICEHCGGAWGAPGSMVTSEGRLCPSCAANRLADPRPIAPAVLPTITLATNNDPIEVQPIRLNDYLALHEAIGTHAERYTYAISHRATGRFVAGFADTEQAEAAFEELALLDWSLVRPDGSASHDLIAAVKAVLARYEGGETAVPTRPMREGDIAPPGLPDGWSITSRAGFDPGVTWYRAIGPSGLKTGEHKSADGATQAARKLAGDPLTQDMATALEAEFGVPVEAEVIDADVPPPAPARPARDLVFACERCGRDATQRLNVAGVMEHRCAACGTLPIRPARPPRDDVSVLLDYVRDLEDYATALEQALERSGEYGAVPTLQEIEA